MGPKYSTSQRRTMYSAVPARPRMARQTSPSQPGEGQQPQRHAHAPQHLLLEEVQVGGVSRDTGV